MKRIKVRFHLGRGVNYRHWRIQYPNGDVQFVHPTQFQIHLIGCQVKNSKKTSQRIFEGYEKVVCAWILCDEVRIVSHPFYSEANCDRLTYNPKVTPNWVCNGTDVDNANFGFIFNVDYRLYIK